MTWRLNNGEPVAWYPKVKLTPQQAKTLVMIRRLTTESKTPPSLRELSKELGVSFARAQELVDGLVAKGQIEREKGRSRAIRVVTGWLQSNNAKWA